MSGSGLDQQRDRILEICRHHRAREVRQANTAQERQTAVEKPQAGVWRGGPAEPQLLQHKTAWLPRTRLPHILRKIREIGERYSICATVNVFHAGDGQHSFPFCCSTNATRSRCAGYWRPAAKSCASASPAAQRDGRTRHRRGKARLHARNVLARRTSTPCAACAKPSNPDGPVSPGKNAPHRRRLRAGAKSTPAGEQPCNSSFCIHHSSFPMTSPLPLTASTSPADQAELAATMCDAYEQGEAMYPVGGGTSLDFGLPPRTSGSPHRARSARPHGGLSGPRHDHHRGSRLTMAALTDALAAERQRLPIDVRMPSGRRGGVWPPIPADRGATARGTIPRLRDRHQRRRRLRPAVQRRRPSGQECRRLRLLQAADGIAGHAGGDTQLTFKLKPLAEASALVACDLADLPTADRLLAALVTSRTTPSAIETAVRQTVARGPRLAVRPARGAVSPGGRTGRQQQRKWSGLQGQTGERVAEQGVQQPTLVAGFAPRPGGGGGGPFVRGAFFCGQKAGFGGPENFYFPLFFFFPSLYLHQSPPRVSYIFRNSV